MKAEALAMGFTHAACGPFVRSSYHADLQAKGWKLSNPVIITYICLIKNPLFEAGFCIEQDIEGASCSPRHSL